MRLGVNALRLWGQRLGTGRSEYLLKDCDSMLESDGHHTRKSLPSMRPDLLVHPTAAEASLVDDRGGDGVGATVIAVGRGVWSVTPRLRSTS